VPHKIPSSSPEAERGELNRSLAHFSYDRASHDTTSKYWEFKLIFSEITASWNVFLAALRMTARSGSTRRGTRGRPDEVSRAPA
jgi:hypothetical protein